MQVARKAEETREQDAGKESERSLARSITTRSIDVWYQPITLLCSRAQGVKRFSGPKIQGYRTKRPENIGQKLIR